LTRLNARGLAGKWYGWWLKQHENDPRSSQYWARARDHLQWEVIGREAPDEYKRNTDADPHWDWAMAPEVREKVRPVVAEMARTASFLASAGISLNADAHKLFTDAVSDLLYQALSILEQRADGDHTPDETPKSFPKFNEGSVEPLVGPSCWDLFEGWVKAAQRAGGSVHAHGAFSWRCRRGLCTQAQVPSRHTTRNRG
jgi:hypothetical protein